MLGHDLKFKGKTYFITKIKARNRYTLNLYHGQSYSKKSELNIHNTSAHKENKRFKKNNFLIHISHELQKNIYLDITHHLGNI